MKVSMTGLYYYWQPAKMSIKNSNCNTVVLHVNVSSENREKNIFAKHFLFYSLVIIGWFEKREFTT